MYPSSSEVGTLIAATGAPGTWPAAAASIPSHIAGATAGSASRFATGLTRDNSPKWRAINGAVATVAAKVIAAPSASASANGPRAPNRDLTAAATGPAIRRIPSTAAKLSCQPTSAAIPGSIASVIAAAATSA